METPFKRLDNIIFVITGEVETFANRSELQFLIKELGGTLSSKVSAKTCYLINNNPNSVSSKNREAIKLGIQIISENEFNEMIGRA